MTNLFLFLALGFGIVYLILLFMPSFVENMIARKIIGFCFMAASFSFLVYLYLSTRKILWVIIAVPLIFLGQIILQLISGAVIRAILKKP